MTTLRGMTWSHPRGYDPMVGASKVWKDRTGVEVVWDKRSLQDFESYPVAELAERYDLIVIDHPHVGQITGEGCLMPLDVPGREADRAALAAGSIGESYPSYTWKGRQWAFPIDAATQVQAFRPDLIDRPAASFAEVIALARDGRVMLPLRPPHSLMCFFTLAAHLGTPCSVEGPDLIAPEAGAEVVRRLRALAAVVDPACRAMDPIAVFESMSERGSTIACAPLAYGYVSYAVDGFRPHRLAFADMPAEGARPPAGSALGGTGIAVSARTKSPEAALDFAYWIASGDVQRGVYAVTGGQPGHAAAWEDETVNAATHDFYRATRKTLDSAWVRPRHDGYMSFQHEAAELITDALMTGREAEDLVAALNRRFAASFGGGDERTGS
jgi:multiple sugar transport system substrate-binding protein